MFGVVERFFEERREELEPMATDTAAGRVAGVVGGEENMRENMFAKELRFGLST